MTLPLPGLDPALLVCPLSSRKWWQVKSLGASPVSSLPGRHRRAGPAPGMQLLNASA